MHTEETRGAILVPLITARGRKRVLAHLSTKKSGPKMALRTFKITWFLTYDGEYDEPLEGDPPDEPHGGPPQRVRAGEDEERAGQLLGPLLAQHGRLAARHLGGGWWWWRWSHSWSQSWSQLGQGVVPADFLSLHSLFFFLVAEWRWA